jgi:acyl transferase domain-containing protein
MIDRVGQLSNSLDPADFQEILGVLDIQSAYRASPSLDVAERKTRLESGIARLETSLSRSSPKDASSPGDLITKAWLVEGLASVDPKRAIREAREAIVEYSQVMQRMSDEWSSEVKIQAIDAFFRCLMVVSGIEEASATVLTRIEAIPPEDQQLLRHTVVASELRTLVSKSAFPKGVHGEILSGSVLRSMLRIGSDHPEVRDLLDRYYDGDQAQRPDSLVELLVVDAESTQDTFLMALGWTKRIMNSQGERGMGQDESFPVVSERDLEGFVGLLAYWIQKSSSRSVPWEGLGTICESFLRAFPNSPDLKIGSAVLAMRFQKWDIAIGYLENIGPNSPNRVLIDGLLQEARKRSSMVHAK